MQCTNPWINEFLCNDYVLSYVDNVVWEEPAASVFCLVDKNQKAPLKHFNFKLTIMLRMTKF